jgi:hypothetical protein
VGWSGRKRRWRSEGSWGWCELLGESQEFTKAGRAGGKHDCWINFRLRIDLGANDRVDSDWSGTSQVNVPEAQQNAGLRDLRQGSG